MGVRMVAGAYAVLGLSVAFFALYAIALDPATFQQLHLQMAKESGTHPPEQGQTGCAATAADAMEMCTDAVVLLLLAAAQAVTAMSAVVGTGRLGVILVLALLLSVPMAWRLTAVFAAVVNLAIGRCHDHGVYHQFLVACYAILGIPSALLFISLVVVF